MKHNVAKFAVLGGFAGAVVLCLSSLVLLRFSRGGVFVPHTSWLDVVWSTIFSTNTAVGAVLGAVTGYALALEQEAEYEKAAKVCLITGLLMIAYTGGLLMWSLFAGFIFFRRQGMPLQSFISMTLLPMLVSVMVNVDFLWGALLLAASIYLRRQQRGGTHTTAG